MEIHYRRRMVALTVSDWTNISVAIGTFLLAVATYSATSVARRSTKEAYRSRVDSWAPRLVVLDLEVQQGLEKPETITEGNFGFANAGEPIDVAGIGEGKLGMIAVLEIFNDGNASAYVNLIRPADVDIKGVAYLGSEPGRLEHFYDSELIFLQRNTRVRVNLVWRQPAISWSEEPDFPNRLPTRIVSVQMCDTLGSVLDTCTVTFGGYGLMPTPSNPGGWNVAPRDLRMVISNGVLNTFQHIGACARSYPKELAGNSWWRQIGGPKRSQE